MTLSRFSKGKVLAYILTSKFCVQSPLTSEDPASLVSLCCEFTTTRSSDSQLWVVDFSGIAAVYLTHKFSFFLHFSASHLNAQVWLIYWEYQAPRSSSEIP